MTNLQQRVVAGLIALPLLFWSIWLGSPYFFGGLVLVTTLLGLHEFFLLVEKIGFSPVRPAGFGALLVIEGLFFFNQPGSDWFLITIGTSLTLMMIWSILTSKTTEDFQKVLVSHATTLFGVLYVGFLASFLIRLKLVSPPRIGSQLLSLFFMVIMAGDTFAYFTGRALGRHKLAPTISPGKTIEGSCGGIVGSIGFALLARFWFFPQLPLTHAIALAIVMNIVGQLGDLYESLLKRGSGTKDAAAIIPGHGGLLDRLDSLLFNAPILYYYVHFWPLTQ
ncbi:MAG: phosphatidate cytidylyltransferase [Acidobacteria bacterium]|nr:phosphatidate cytidylyltransferase [Acidobacteriota bacterium]